MVETARAIEMVLDKLVQDALSQLDGIPTDDLNRWRPAQELGDINTFFALATHLVGAGEFWILHGAGGRPTERDRSAEFVAEGDPAALRARYDRWLGDVREVLAELTEEDLARVPDLDRGRSSGRSEGWTVADCLLHAVEHTAVHVGHLQIQRQLWDAERGSDRG